MKKANAIKKTLSFVLTAALCTACIKNDIPYPYVEGLITSISFYDQLGEVQIDRQRHSVEATVGERANLNRLPITQLVVNDDAQILPDENACINSSQFPHYSFTSLDDLPANANTAMDFSHPVNILIRTYQDYIWTLYVTQEINRVIRIDHQVGEPQFDPQSHHAIVYIEKGYPLDDIHITEFSLEGSTSQSIPDPSTVTDFTRPQSFEIYKDGALVSTWIIDVQPTEEASTTGEVNAWATKATLYGEMQSGATPVVEYKKVADSDWTTVDASQINLLSSTSFSTEITGLTDNTDYEWRITVNGISGPSATFRTEQIVEVPNLNFDTWTQDGKNWYANSVPNNYDDPQAYWASGNEGVTSTLAGGRDATTEPATGSDAYKGTAAKMHSLTGVPLVGAAAGNLFIGTYKTNLGNPSSSPSFGRPYSAARPTGMRGYYKYTPMPITHQGPIPGNLTMDQGHIYIKLWDASGRLFGYGEFVATERVDTYTEFEFDIEYTDLQARPASMSIVATSSRYGGEFDGARVSGQVGDGSTLWIDEFELLYD